MSDRKPPWKPRKHNRLSTRKGHLEVLLRFPDATAEGHIVDICEDGLGVQYAIQAARSRKPDKVIISWKDSAVIQREPIYCKVVHDRRVSLDLRNLQQIRRCGVQFQGLSQSQSLQLEHAIEAYVSRRPESESLRANGNGGSAKAAD